MHIHARFVALLAAAALTGGCGEDGHGDHGHEPDAMILLSDAAQPDAEPPPPPDARPPYDCNAEGDYVEGDESGNNPLGGGTPESSDLSTDLEDTGVVFGGCVDPAESGPNATDADAYTFTVSGETHWVTIDATSPAGATADGTVVAITDSGVQRVLASGVFQDGTAVMSPARLEPGEYVLIVLNRAELADGFHYQATMTSIQCTSLSDDTPDYTEANDGPQNRGNDVLGVSWTQQGPDITETSNAEDAPEPSGLTMAADTSYLLGGNTANVMPDGDDYLDRDTFSFTTGSDVDRAALFLEWDDTTEEVDVDMDMLLFPADSTSPQDIVAQAASGSTTEDTTGAVLAPDTEYWLWLATWNATDMEGNPTPPTIGANGEPYTVTICTY